MLRENEELKFEYFLAHELKRTVAELREMDGDEFLMWAMYFAQQAQDIQARGR